MSLIERDQNVTYRVTLNASYENRGCYSVKTRFSSELQKRYENKRQYTLNHPKFVAGIAAEVRKPARLKPSGKPHHNA